MPLTDSQGRKVDPGTLLEEIADPQLTGLRQPFWQSIANVLTPELLASVLQSMDMGNAWQYLVLAYELEDRWPHYYSVISTRKRAVSGLQLTITPGAEDAQGKKMADMVRETLSRRRVKPLLDHAMDALSKGYSCVEILWDREGKTWTPRQFKYRDARFFHYDLMTGQELRIFDLADPGFGIPIPPFKMVVHQPNIKSGLPIKRGFARLALASYLCQSYALRDWELFASRFGMPHVFGKYPSTATAQERKKLMDACSGLSAGGSGTFPDTMSIEISAAGSQSGGDRIFHELVEHYDKALSKAVLGQTATTEGTPGKLGADDTQENVREDLRQSDAEEMAATIERDVIKPIIDMNFGPQPENLYPKADLPHETSEDIEKESRALSIYIDRGLRVKESEIRSKFPGLTEPQDDDAVLEGKAAPTPFAPAPDDGSGLEPNRADLPDEDGESTEDPDDVERKSLEPQKNAGKQARRVTQRASVSNAVATLVAKVAAGKKLTEDERLALAASVSSTDVVDELADEHAGRWRKVIDPMKAAIQKLAEECKDEHEFRAKLSKLKLDRRALIDSVATATFKARILGQNHPR